MGYISEQVNRVSTGFPKVKALKSSSCQVVEYIMNMRDEKFFRDWFYFHMMSDLQWIDCEQAEKNI